MRVPIRILFFMRQERTDSARAARSRTRHSFFFSFSLPRHGPAPRRGGVLFAPRVFVSTKFELDARENIIPSSSFLSFEMIAFQVITFRRTHRQVLNFVFVTIVTRFYPDAFECHRCHFCRCILPVSLPGRRNKKYHTGRNEKESRTRARGFTVQLPS